MFLKEGVAATVQIGPFIDDTDGKTAETGLTISANDIYLSKNGANMAVKNEANAAAHDTIGYYRCNLNANDTDTPGRLKLMVHESGALPVWHEFMVLKSNVYDTLCANDQFDVNVTNIEGSDPTDQIRDAVVDDATRIDASALNTLSGYAPASTIAAQTDVTSLNDLDSANVSAAVWDAPAANHVTANTFGDRCGADIDAILADTNELQTDDVPGLIAALNDLDAANVAAAVWDQAANGFANAGTFGQQCGTDIDAILADTNELQSDDVPGLINALNDLDGANVAAAVWDQAANGYANAGTFGQQCGTDIDAILTDTAEIANLNDPTAAAIANEVWAANQANLSITHTLLLERLYQFSMNKMNITDANGAVALRNANDDGNIMTQTITDDSTTTTRTAASWV